MVGWHSPTHGWSKFWETVKYREASCAAVHGVGQDLATEQQQGKG